MANDDEIDILRVPTSPQRRLSRSSIDLRDLEQQQIQQHDRVTHTDSAPSVIALENFYFKNSSKATKSQNIFQPFNISKANILNKPSECFHTRLNNDQKSNAIDTTYTIENDNEDLARFIEDNYQYFKKQNGGTDLSLSTSPALAAITNKTSQKLCRKLQLQACSDPDFLTLKNNIDCCDSCSASTVAGCEKKIKSKKQKMAALSDSDFIVSFGNKSKKFTLKSKLPFKTILNGKFPKATTTLPAPSTSSQSQSQSQSNDTAIAPTIMANTQIDSIKLKKYSHKGLNNNLSKSLNGCYRNKNNESTPTKSKCIQRVLSEGNETTSYTNTTVINDTAQSAANYQRPSYDAFDMFVKLFHCEKNNKNMCDKQTNSKYNYKIVVNSKEYDYDYDICDTIFGNYTALTSKTSENFDKLLVSGDCSNATKTDNVIESISKIDSCSDQLVIVNHPYDENLVFNINTDVSLHNTHVLVNNLVITSPPVTPKQLLSPKTINKEQQQQHSTLDNYFSYSHNHLSPNLLNADTTSISMELLGNKSPLEHLVSLRNDPDILFDFDLKVPDILNVRSNSTTNVNNGSASTEQNFIKNDLALTNSRPKCDKYSSGIGSISRNSGIRKPSVTYDINVINKSQDFNIDDICPQRSSYAARSGSTTSTSKSDSIYFKYFR